MHGLRRPGRNYHVHRVFLQIFLKEADGRPHPADPRVRDKKIPPYPHHYPLLEALFTGVHHVDLLLRSFLPCQLSVKTVYFVNRGLYYDGLVGDVSQKRLVHGLHFGIGWSIDDRLPSLLRKILREFYPALYAGASGRRPVVGDYEYSFHSAKINKTLEYTPTILYLVGKR